MADDHEMGAHLERILRSAGQEVPGSKPILEINPKHQIVKELDRRVKASKESKETEDFAKLLFDVAGMTSGYDVEDMSAFASRVMDLMSGGAVGSVQDADVVSEDASDETPAADVEVVE